MKPTLKQFKRLVDDLGGNQSLIAEELGLSAHTITNIIKEKTPIKPLHIHMLQGLKQSLNGRKLV